MRPIRYLTLSLVLIFLISIKPVKSQKYTSEEEKELYSKLIVFSHEGGLYDEPFYLFVDGKADKYYYTTDGSIPIVNSKQLFDKPIVIDTNIVVRVRPVVDGILMDTVFTQSYFVGFKTTFAIMSLTTAPTNLRGYTGIYSNYSRKWERPVHVEFFETNGERVINQAAGIKLFGGRTRRFPEKSLQIVARKKYSKKKFNYRFFPDKDIKKFDRLVLRTSGNDFTHSRFLDAMTTSLVKDLDVLVQAYRPTIMFINGEYRGIYNLREKINADFLESNKGADPDSTDILFKTGSRENGSSTPYRKMLSYIRTHNIAQEKHYDSLNKLMDVSNYINFKLTQLYIANRDKGNMRFWRANNLDGRFRWILYDTDAGFGASFKAHYNFLHKNLVLDTAWYNKPWSTFLLRSLVKNDNFRSDFINQTAFMFNTVFKEDVVVNAIDSFQTLLEPEIDAHLARYRRNKVNWQRDIERLRKFARKRPDYFKKHTINEFNLDTMYKLKIRIEPPEAGNLYINYNKVKNNNHSGWYFTNFDLPIRIDASNLYVFDRWEGVDESETNFVLKTSKDSIDIAAIFRPCQKSIFNDSIIISEICFRNNKKNGDDWVEIFNNSNKTINLGGWKLSDIKNEYIIPTGTALSPKSYIVISKNMIKFSKAYNDSIQIIGNFKFGLNKENEKVVLFDADKKIADIVEYNFSNLNKSDLENKQFTIYLDSYELDNELISNWKSKKGHGTPGKSNKIVNKTTNKSSISEDIKSTLIYIGVIFLVSIAIFFMLKKISKSQAQKSVREKFIFSSAKKKQVSK